MDLNGLRMEIPQREQVQSKIRAMLPDIQTEEDLVEGLREVWGDIGLLDDVDHINRLLEESWVSEPMKKKLKVEKGKKKQGLKGRLLGIRAGIEGVAKGIRKQDVPSLPAGTWARKYEEHLIAVAEQEWPRDKPKTNGTRLKVMNSLRIAMIMTGAFSGVTQQLIEGHGGYHSASDFLLPDTEESDHPHIGEILGDAASDLFETIVDRLADDSPVDALDIHGLESDDLDEILSEGLTGGGGLSEEQVHHGGLQPEHVIDNHTDGLQSGTDTHVAEHVTNQEQVPHEATNIYEFVFSPLLSEIQEARHDRYNAMTLDQQEKFEAAVGTEMLNWDGMVFWLVGKDTAEGEGRGDTIIGLVVDPTDGDIQMISINRDLRVPELDGRPINTAWWVDQDILEKEGRYEFLDPSVAREIFEDATGLPADAMLEINFDAFTSIARTVFGNKIPVTIEEGQGYYSRNLDISFEEGQTYELTPEELLNFVRERKTTSTFHREARQMDVVELLIDIGRDHFVNNPEKLLSLGQRVVQTVRDLESEERQDLRLTWDVDIADSQGRDVPVNLTQMLKLYMASFADILKDLRRWGDLIKVTANTAGSDELMPDIDKFALSANPESDVRIVSDGTKFVMEGQEQAVVHSERSLSYWETLRLKVAELLKGKGMEVPTTNKEAITESEGQKNEETKTPTQEDSQDVLSPEHLETAETLSQFPVEESRIMIIGDSMVSGGMVPEYLAQHYPDASFIGSQEHFGKNQVPHEAYGGASTVDILNNLHNLDWEHLHVSGSNELHGVIPDVIFLQVGTNDISAGRDISSEVIPNLESIITLLREKNPSIRIVLSHIPPSLQEWNSRVDEYNTAIDRLANTLNSNESPISVSLLNDLSVEHDIGEDGVHLTRSGDQDVVSSWVEAVAELEQEG